MAIETPWDAANVALGVASAAANISQGNYGAAAVDALGVAIDVAATATPGVPGGAATGIKAARCAEESTTIYKTSRKFSKATKKAAADRADYKCEYCGVSTVPAQKSQRGVSPPKNEAQTDHIIPYSKGGDGSLNNAAHSCRDCNRSFSNSNKVSPR